MVNLKLTLFHRFSITRNFYIFYDGRKHGKAHYKYLSAISPRYYIVIFAIPIYYEELYTMKLIFGPYDV